jgi:hypothetical protein
MTTATMIAMTTMTGIGWQMTNNRGEDHDDGHHHNTENHRHEQLLVGWEQVPLQNSETTATPPPGQMK